MTADLAHVFELMHGAADSFQSVRAAIRVWRHDERFSRAFEREMEERQAEGHGGMSFMVSLGGGPEAPPPSPEHEDVHRLWIEKPDKRREEVEGEHPHSTVTDGTKSWAYSPWMGAIEQDVQPDEERGESDALFHPERILPALDFEVVGPGTACRRSAIRLRGLPRPSRHRRHHFFRP